MLFDSMFLHHYFEPMPWIDEVYRAAAPLMSNYAVEMVQQMDLTLPQAGGFSLQQIQFNRIVNFFRTHGREINPPEIVANIDFYRALNEVLLDGFDRYELCLRAEHQAKVDQIMQVLRKDGRPLIGIQNRAHDWYGQLQITGDAYIEAISEIAHQLVERYGARILMCGDVKIPSDFRYKRGDWFDLDGVANIYYKIDILRQVDLMIGALSGFSLLVNFVRGQAQRPVIFPFCRMESLRGEMVRRAYPDYEAQGGFCSMAYNAVVFRDAKLLDLVSNEHQSAHDVLEVAAHYMRSW